MSKHSAALKNPHRFMGVPRELIGWYPQIDDIRCNGCNECMVFCAHDVYALKDGHVKVINPKNCVVFCQACLKMCPVKGAMIFPPKKDVLKEIRELKMKLKANPKED